MADHSLFFHLDSNLPDTVVYQRLEPSPYSEKFERNLNTEVRDAHWMLFRQWQVGEFIGEDAGTAWKVRVAASHYKMKHLHANNKAGGSMEEDKPLEALVESEPLQPDLRVRLQLGNLFKNLLNDAGLSANFPEFQKIYAFDDPASTEIANDPEVSLVYLSIKHKALDGWKLLIDLWAYQDNLDSWANEHITDKTVAAELIAAVCLQFINQVEYRYNFRQKSPNGEQSFWQTDQLEYQFGLANEDFGNSGETDDPDAQMTVKSYSEGSLDWYHFDLEKVPSVNDFQKRAFMPVPMQIKSGMPVNWWGIEEGSFNLSKILVKDTGLLDTLFIEFALNHGNDWFIIPYTMDINTLCKISSIVVTDVFGIQYIIRTTNEQPEDKYGWSIFSQTGAKDGQIFYLAPTLLKSEESKPLEKIYFMRDEGANLVWAVQDILPNQLGKGVSGYESSRLPEAPSPSGQSDRMKFILGTPVPSNWIPFLPVSLDGAQKEIILQRSRMPDSLADLPRGVLLSEDTTTPLKYYDEKDPNEEKTSKGYFVREEAIPRAGLQVDRHYQRARWVNGETVTWIGRKKKVGKGEGSSGLVFDQLTYIDK
jgi:hypothetical protein